MRRLTLGQKLRAIVLAVPFAGAVACGSSSSGVSCPNETETWLLSSIDGGFTGDNCNSVCVSFMVPPGQSCSCTDIPCSFTTQNGAPAVSCNWRTPSGCCCITGRRPPSLLPSTSVRSAHPIGAFFAEAARLEAASVPAFRLLARELAAHGAPVRLVRAARSAAGDEVRHTRATAALARRYGARAVKARLGKLPRGRSLEAIAVENAVEGCVRETYGALVGLWQARAAGDPVVAAAMKGTAADETRHAELAWQVDAWAGPRLGRAARQRVAEARASAFAELRAEAARPVPAAQVALAGLPTPEVAARLLDGLEGAQGG
jgi:hypothetical protein